MTTAGHHLPHMATAPTAFPIWQAIEAEMAANNLQILPTLVKKCIQTYESKLTRHGNMLVGPSLSGKSTTWKMLSAAMSRLKKVLARIMNMTRAHAR